jgi:hypothetical protein
MSTSSSVSITHIEVKPELIQLRAAVVRSEKLVAEAENSSRTQRKGNVCHRKPQPSNS